MARKTQTSVKFDYKIGGISAKWYLGIALLVYLISIPLHLLSLGWAGSPFNLIFPLVVATAVAVVTEYVGRLWRFLHR